MYEKCVHAWSFGKIGYPAKLQLYVHLDFQYVWCAIVIAFTMYPSIHIVCA